MRRAERRELERAAARAGAARRPSGSSLPRAPPRASGAAACPASRRASIVFPVPGGPASSRLCRAGRGDLERPSSPFLPRTSARSGYGSDRPRGRPPDRRAGFCSPRRYAAASARWRRGTGSMPASATSAADSAGAEEPVDARRRRAASAHASAPGTGRSRPSSASSPSAACSARRSAGSCRDAASTASAMGRSKPEPSFRRPAGARLTVMRRSGHSSSALAMPLRTRSFASWHALSGSPTMANAGTPR